MVSIAQYVSELNRFESFLCGHGVTLRDGPLVRRSSRIDPRPGPVQPRTGLRFVLNAPSEAEWSGGGGSFAPSD